MSMKGQISVTRFRVIKNLGTFGVVGGSSIGAWVVGGGVVSTGTLAVKSIGVVLIVEVPIKLAKRLLVGFTIVVAQRSNLLAGEDKRFCRVGDKKLGERE